MAFRFNPSDGNQFPDGASRKEKIPPSRHNCGTLPPEVHYQVSKKIAQLTKVIFTLNARLDEQESMMEALKDAYEERLQQLLSDTKQRISQYKSKANASNDLQHKITELEGTLALERAAKEELVQALKVTREKKLTEQCCKSWYTQEIFPLGLGVVKSPFTQGYVRPKKVDYKLGRQSLIGQKQGQSSTRLLNSWERKNRVKFSGANLTNGLYPKSLSKDYDGSISGKGPLRNKEEEMEIIERILRKKSNVGKADGPSKPNLNNNSKVKQVVDIPEKDGSREPSTPPSPAPAPHRTVSGTGSVKTEDLRSEPKSSGEANKNKCELCDLSDSERSRWVLREKELLNRLTENRKDIERMREETKNFNQVMSSTSAELKRFQQKATVPKIVAATQTDLRMRNESETQTENHQEDSLELNDKAKKVEAELKATLNELQSISTALNETKVEIQNTHLELRRFSADEQPQLRQFSSNASRNTREETDASTDSLNNERTKAELKDKVSELLEQVTILMTSGGNMSDAEKENAELQKKLAEKDEASKRLLASKDAQLAAALNENEARLKQLEQELTRQHNLAIEVALINHRRELESVIRHGEEKWAQQKENIQQEHDEQLAKVQEEVNEMSRRLQSQTEMQTAELSRLNHDLDEALNMLRQKEEDLLLQEREWRKDTQEKRESYQEQLLQAQKQSDQFLKQLDQKRDELLQVRREATQQIRNLENYWLEKVNQELNRLKRAFTEEKKKMLENFCKSQRLLKDKIIALQTQETTEEVLNDLDKDAIDPSIFDHSKEINCRVRRNSIVSQIEFPTHDNDLIDFTEALEKADDRICASQPNVAQLPPQPRITSKKGKSTHEHRFIKRAESVFLPKLQFLSFWKSASSLDKAHCQKHRDISSSSQSFAKESPSTGASAYQYLVQTTPEIDPRKKQKMSPTFFKNRSGSEGFDVFSFQEARSSSCFNLSCKGGGSSPVFGVEPYSILNKSKRNSVGSNNYLGVVPEAQLDDTEEQSKLEEESNSKEPKEPLLESEL